MKNTNKPLFIILAEKQSEFVFPTLVFTISLFSLIGIGYAGYVIPNMDVWFIIYLILIAICFGVIFYFSIRLFINAIKLKKLLSKREKLNDDTDF